MTCRRRWQDSGLVAGPAVAWKDLFLSHPPIEQRIAALQARTH